MPKGFAGIIGGAGFSGVPEEAMILSAMFETKNRDRLMMTTEIIPELIYPLACLELIADEFQSKLLKNFGTRIYQLEVSKDRKGRDELTEALLSVRRGEGEPD